MVTAMEAPAPLMIMIMTISMRNPDRTATRPRSRVGIAMVLDRRLHRLQVAAHNAVRIIQVRLHQAPVHMITLEMRVATRTLAAIRVEVGIIRLIRVTMEVVSLKPVQLVREVESAGSSKSKRSNTDERSLPTGDNEHGPSLDPGIGIIAQSL